MSIPRALPLRPVVQVPSSLRVRHPNVRKLLSFKNSNASGRRVLFPYHVDRPLCYARCSGILLCPLAASSYQRGPSPFTKTKNPSAVDFAAVAASLLLRLFGMHPHTMLCRPRLHIHCLLLPLLLLLTLLLIMHPRFPAPMSISGALRRRTWILSVVSP